MPYEKPQLKKEDNKKELFPKLLADFTKKIKELPELQFLKEFNQQFPESNIYLVGGMVRDAARGTQIMSKDFDFVVNKINLDNLINFLEQRGKVNLVGRNFGVIKFMPKSSPKDGVHTLTEPIDIALPRTEFSVGEGGGYKDFEVQADENLSVKDDLSRRDITVNAMALDIKTGQIVDPFNGLDSLADNIIEAVLNPADRFKEDYSRMLRALRFAVRFDFDIEEKTAEAIRKLAPHLNDKRVNDKGKEEWVVPRETIAKEFLKTFQADPVKTIELYNKYGFLKLLLPEIKDLQGVEQNPEWHQEGDVWNHTILALQTATSDKFREIFGKEPSLEVLVATLLHDIGKPPTIERKSEQGKEKITAYGHDKIGTEMTKKILDRLKFSSYNGIIDHETVIWLVAQHMKFKGQALKEMKNNKMKKYFLDDPVLGEKLQMVLYCDEQASIAKIPLNDFQTLQDRLAEIKKLNPTKAGEKITLLVDGKDIMKLKIKSITGETISIPPGKIVGQLKNLTEEAQLSGQIKTKEQGLELIEKFLTTQQGQELLDQALTLANKSKT